MVDIYYRCWVEVCFLVGLFFFFYGRFSCGWRFVVELVMKFIGSCFWELGKGWAGSFRSRGVKNLYGEWF